MKITNNKYQISNKYQLPKFKIQNRIWSLEIEIWNFNRLGHWIFEFGYYLEFGYWDLGFQE
jgi:hypothetical protein